MQFGLDEMMARHSPGVHERMKAGRVAIAGLGGLGSNIAVMLARMGVGTLLLTDYDTVEPSNLNRQHYTTKHIGQPKTLAIKSQLAEINPYTKTLTRDIEITAENAAQVFEGYPIVVEAFDNPVCKAALVEGLLSAGSTKIVAASGMAGFGSANEIKTVRRLGNLYICGDMQSDASDIAGLMAPRVLACSAHQANMVVRLIMGINEE